MKESVELEDADVTIERTIDGIKLVILFRDGENIELHLSFQEAAKLGKMLLSESRAGITQMDLLIKKLSDIEHSIHKMEEKMKELEKKSQTSSPP